MRIYPVFHVSILKPYKESPNEFSHAAPPSPVTIPGSDEPEYE
ncbi:633_t:CDS:1, partial [Acaulospora morrowiae]